MKIHNSVISIAGVLVATIVGTITVEDIIAKRQNSAADKTTSEQKSETSPPSGAKVVEEQSGATTNIQIANNNSSEPPPISSEPQKSLVKTPKNKKKQNNTQQLPANNVIPSSEEIADNTARSIAHLVSRLKAPYDASDAVFLRNYRSFQADQARLKYLVDNYPSWNLLIAIQARAIMSEVVEEANNMLETSTTRYVSEINTGNLHSLKRKLNAYMDQLDADIRKARGGY